MLRWSGLLCLSFLLGGDSRLPQEEARQYARVCSEQAKNLADPQLQVVVNTEKACAVRGEGGGAMIIPDRGLTLEKLRQAGTAVLPVGQLWLRKWTVVRAGKAVAREKLRVLTLRVDDKDRPMVLFLLGARQGKQGLELVAYARDSQPLLVLPLKGIEQIPELPLEMEWERGEKNADPLTLRLLGRYQTVVTITRQGP